MWVELRRSLKYMGLKSFTRFIWLETYRQYKLFSPKQGDVLDIILGDFGLIAKSKKEIDDDKWLMETC